MSEPSDYHDQIRWKRLGLFLLIAVPLVTAAKIWVSYG